MTHFYLVLVPMLQDINVYVADPYVVVTWLPPLYSYPELSLPVSFAMFYLVKDCTISEYKQQHSS